MKSYLFFVAMLAIPLSSCEMLPEEREGEGSIILRLQPAESLTRSFVTKGSSGSADGRDGGNGGEFAGEPDGDWTDVTVNNTVMALDTNSFKLSIYDSQGKKIYSGKYSERPEEIIVTPGSYDIKLHSVEFKTPKFNAPMFGDEQTVIVEKDKKVNVVLRCRQLNAGLRLEYTESFNKRYIFNVRVKDAHGEAYFPKATKDYCYFLPGQVEMIYKENGKDTTLMTRVLNAGEMLHLVLTYSQNSMYNVSRISIDMDTSRVWASEKYNTALKIPPGVLSIEEAKKRVGEKDLSVFGFILGGDATERTMRIGPPFSVATHIVIAPTMLERNRNNCFVVELPNGRIRDALNLVVNDNLLGSPIVVVGDVVESYYGYIGIKKTDDFTLLNH